MYPKKRASLRGGTRLAMVEIVGARHAVAQCPQDRGGTEQKIGKSNKKTVLLQYSNIAMFYIHSSLSFSKRV